MDRGKATTGPAGERFDDGESKGSAKATDCTRHLISWMCDTRPVGSSSTAWAGTASPRTRRRDRRIGSVREEEGHQHVHAIGGDAVILDAHVLLFHPGGANLAQGLRRPLEPDLDRILEADL